MLELYFMRYITNVNVGHAGFALMLFFIWFLIIHAFFFSMTSPVLIRAGSDFG